MAENRVIGREAAVPWHLPEDMRQFKRLTTGHPVIMGRRTFDSLGRPLPHRRNVVLTRDPSYAPEGVEVAHGLDEALALVAGEQEVFVAGGADIYRLALPRADRLYLTIVHAAVTGDTRFPDLDLSEWRLDREAFHPADERHEYPFTFRFYSRRAPSKL